MTRLSFLLLAFLLLQAITGDEEPASVVGCVVTSNGMPAPNISILLKGVYPPATHRKDAETDAYGSYHIDHLAPGQYVIFPYDAGYDYPIRSGTFFSVSPDRFTLRPGERLSKTLVLPPPAGIISGLALDMNGSPLVKASIVLCHDEAPKRAAEISTDQNGAFEYIAPSGEYISILVTAESGIARQINHIILKPREHKMLTISLKDKTIIEGDKCIPFRPS